MSRSPETARPPDPDRPTHYELRVRDLGLPLLSVQRISPVPEPEKEQ